MSHRMKQVFAGLLVVMAMAQVGCNKKGDDSAPITTRNARGGNQPNYQSQGYYYTAATGRVSVSSQYANEFTDAVRGLLSATVHPDSVGSISPTDGVKLRGYVEVDQQGRALTGKSSISLEIRDSYTGTIDSGSNQPIAPIYVNLPLTQGTAWNGQANLVFADQYGEVRLNGSFQGGQFWGTVSYNNQTHVISGEAPHSASRMGDFQIDSCGFFRCQ